MNLAINDNLQYASADQSFWVSAAAFLVSIPVAGYLVKTRSLWGVGERERPLGG